MRIQLTLINLTAECIFWEPWLLYILARVGSNFIMKIQFFWDITMHWLVNSYTLETLAATVLRVCSGEDRDSKFPQTSVTIQWMTWHHIPKQLNPPQHLCESLKLHNFHNIFGWSLLLGSRKHKKWGAYIFYVG